MSERPTPETDSETNYCDAIPDMPWVDAGVARRLERERNEAREALREIAAADWRTSGELRGMAKQALQVAK